MLKPTSGITFIQSYFRDFRNTKKKSEYVHFDDLVTEEKPNTHARSKYNEYVKSKLNGLFIFAALCYTHIRFVSFSLSLFSYLSVTLSRFVYFSARSFSIESWHRYISGFRTAYVFYFYNTQPETYRKIIAVSPTTPDGSEESEAFSYY